MKMRYLDFLVVLAALLPSSSEAQGNEEDFDFTLDESTAGNFTLDLYVRDRYVTADGEPCTFCEERDGCYLDSRAFYIQNECRSRGLTRNSVYGEVGGFPDRVCRKDFDDDGSRCDIEDEMPIFDVTQLTECDARWAANECSQDSIQMSLLEGWCIQSDLPIAPFVMPIAEVLTYSDVAECVGEGENFVSAWYPIDKSLCLGSTVDLMVGNMTEKTYGSQRYYCEGSTFRSESFVDRNCSEATPPPRDFLDGVMGFCPEDSNRGNARVIADCTSPSIYCKDLYSTDFGFNKTTSAPTPSPAGSQDVGLDLFIRDRYRTADGELCEFCEERDGCFLDSRAFYIENECRSRGENQNAIYSRIEGSPNTVCRQDFIADDTRCDVPGQEPIFDITQVSNCDARWTVDTCTESIEMSVLESWCIPSSVPVDEYVMPMATVLIYSDADECTSSSGEFLTAWYPVNDLLCMTASVEEQVGNESIPVYGSQMYYCDGSVFRSEGFVDQECTDPTNGRDFLDGVSDVCIDNPQGQGRVIADCAAPSFHCKDLYSTDFGSEIVTTMPSPSPTKNPELLDLYVRERFRTTGGDQCGFCEEKDDCFLESRAFYVENLCRSRGADLNAIYNRIEGFPDVVCRQDYIDDGTRCDISDLLPLFNTSEVVDCDARWIADACSIESIGMQVMAEWCIESDRPVEPFVVPMVEALVYGDSDACGNETADFATSWFPVDEALCLEASVNEIQDGEPIMVYGSQKYYCEGSVFKSETYTDRHCSTETSGPRDFFDGVTDDCSDESARGQGRVLVNCAAPSLFCKDLYSTHFGFELIPSSPPTSSPIDSPSLSPVQDPTEEPTPTDDEVDSGAKSRFSGIYLASVLYFLIF